MNDTQVIGIIVSVVVILFLHYTITQCHHSEYFTTLNNSVTSAPLRLPISRDIMQTLLTKLTNFLYRYTNNNYGPQIVKSNEADMKQLYALRFLSLNEILELPLTNANAIIDMITSFTPGG